MMLAVLRQANAGLFNWSDGSQKQEMETLLLTIMIEHFETNPISHFPPFYDDFFL